MNEAASFAADGTWRSSSHPGDEFSSAFRDSTGYRKAVVVATVCALMSVGLILLALTRSLTLGTGETTQTATLFSPDLESGLSVNQVHSADGLMVQLKAHSLWKLPADNRVPLVIFSNYPNNLDSLDVETKKKAFLHALLPSALVARAEVARERTALEEILARFKDPGDLNFDDNQTDWQSRLTQPEIEFINHLADKYRSPKARDLLVRVDTFPVSLILAQAALESSWGSSRFAEKGNNIFGMWTWGKKGLVPADRGDDKNHKVAVYNTILGSVRAYLLTLNRLPAYRQLRLLRQETRDPLTLAEGLDHYSERGMDYVTELRQIIRYNQLERYDNCRLAHGPPTVSSGGLSQL